MKKINLQFDVESMKTIKNMIGKTMLKYKCDPFEFSTSVYGIIGIELEDSSYAFTNTVTAMDYYGKKEDVAVFKMENMSFKAIKSMIQNQNMLETPVNSIIADVLVVNEEQQLFENNLQTYEVLITRGIIFIFKDKHELSFEKDIWFSEDITVEKGYNLIQRFTPTTEFEKSWSGNYKGKCFRKIISCMDEKKFGSFNLELFSEPV